MTVPGPLNTRAQILSGALHGLMLAVREIAPFIDWAQADPDVQDTCAMAIREAAEAVGEEASVQ